MGFSLGYNSSWASLVAQMVNNLPAMQKLRVRSLGQEYPPEKAIPWVRKIPGEEKGDPLQYSCLKNSLDRGASQATVHGVTKSQTQLND